VYDLDHASAKELGRAFAATSSKQMAWSPALQFEGEFTKHELSAPAAFDLGLELMGYRLLSGIEGKPGDVLPLVTMWRVTAEMPPASGDLKTFVHLLDEQGQMKAGQDRLDSEPLTWEPGDLWLQVHHLPIPSNAAPGRYQIELGLYVPDTMQRLAVRASNVPVADRLLLQPIEVTVP
jgi:hypothetical protein